MENKNRIHPRLKNYDYSAAGSYFVTVCSKDKAHIFGQVSVGRDDPGAPSTELTAIGKLVEKYILSVNEAYEDVSVDKYVVMPNHIHLLLTICAHGAPGGHGLAPYGFSGNYSVQAFYKQGNRTEALAKFLLRPYHPG